LLVHVVALDAARKGEGNRRALKAIVSPLFQR